MACTTTSSYKENIYNPDIEQTISVIINNKTVDPSFVKAIKYDDKIFEVESISIGNAVAREIQLELSNQFTEEFTEVSLSSTLHIETPETLALGTYMIVEKDNSNDYYTKYILHDYMDKFHKKYDASSMVPCTRFALLQSICNYCGVELENSSIINGDVIVNTYDNTIEALEYVRCIAERAAGNAKITRYNKLKIKELNTNENIILPNEMIGDYSYDDQKIITKVIFENATQKFEKGNNTGECICLSQYSPFSCTQEEVNNIFQSLNGLTYQSLKARIWGDPSVDAGDRLTYGNIKSFAQMSWQWGNGFYGEYDCSLKTNQQTSLVERLSNSQKIRRIKSILDESNMQIDLLLEENDENKTSIANLNLNLESIKSSVTKKIEDLENDTSPIAAQKGVKSATIYDAAEKSIMWQKTYGKSTQTTRSGKNLFTKQGNATPATDTTFWNLITHTTPESDGWCKVSVDNTNGTATVFANQFTKRNTIDKLEVNKTYSILVEVRNLTMSGSGSSSTPSYLQLCETAKNSVWQSIQNYDLAIFKETNKAVFQMLTKTNFDSSTMDFRNFVSVAKGYKVEFEYRLMVVKGSYTLDTIGEYEPYGVSPSPDFPSPIESVGRKNIIKSLSSKWSAGINYNLDNSLIKKTMTFSCIIDTSITSANLYIIPATGVSAINLGTINFTANQRVVKTFDLTDEQIQVIKSNQGGIFQIYKSSAFESANITDAQLEKGTVATDYVPYEHTEISETVTGKNLVNPNLPVNSKTQNGITITNNGDGTYTATGTSTSSLAISLTQKNTIKLNKSTSYTNSIEILEGNFLGAIVVAVLDSEDKITYNYINVSSSSLSNTKTPTEDLTIKTYEYYIDKANITVNFKFRVQLEEGTVATEYEEYKSNSLTIDLRGNELCSLPNGIKDEVNITNGEALLTKRIDKVILNGSENWTLYSNKTHTFALKMGQTIGKHDRAYCSHFTEIGSDKFDVATGIYSAYTNTIIISYLDCDTVDAFKTWLSTHNVEVLYEVAEPEEIDLGKTDLPNAYRGINHITFTELSDFYYYRDNALNEIYVSKDENEKQIRNINENFAKQEITNNSIIQRVQETNETMSNNYALKEEVSSEIQHTKNSLTIEFNEQIEDLQNKQVDTLKNQLVTIDVNGIAVSTNTSAIKTIMNNDRFAIKSGDTEAFYVGYDENLKKSVSRMNDLTITDYFTAGYHRQERFEIDGEKRTGWFYVGGE